MEKQTHTGSLRTFLFCSIFTILAFICLKSTRKTSELRHWCFKQFLHNSSGPLLLVVWLLVKRFVLLTSPVGKKSSPKFFRKTLGQSPYKDAFLLLFFLLIMVKIKVEKEQKSQKLKNLWENYNLIFQVTIPDKNCRLEYIVWGNSFYHSSLFINIRSRSLKSVS